MSRNGLVHPLTAALHDGGEDREFAIRKIRKALVEAEGRVIGAAEILGVNRMTMFRLMAAAGLSEEASNLRVAAGVSGPRREPAGRKLPRQRAKKT